MTPILQRVNFATSNKRILQRVTSDFLQQVTSDFSQRATSATSNERILQRVTSDFLQRATSATNNERILQRVTSDFSTSNEQRVKSYASVFTHGFIQLFFNVINRKK